MTREQRAQVATILIIDDLRSRSGLGNEWHEIDDDVRAEIRQAWTKIIVEFMA